MEELVADISYVKTLLGKLTDILQEEYEDRAIIEQKLGELGANVRQDIQRISTETETELSDEKQEILALEKENTSLLQILQKQDYINDCYEEVLAKDEELLTLIKASVVTKKRYDAKQRQSYSDKFRDSMQKLDHEICSLRTRSVEFQKAKLHVTRKMADDVQSFGNY